MRALPATVLTAQTASYCEDLPVTIQSIHAVCHIPVGACLRREENRRSNERAGGVEAYRVRAV